MNRIDKVQELVVYDSASLDFILSNIYPLNNNASYIARGFNCSLEFRRTRDQFNNRGIIALVVGEDIKNLESIRDYIHQEYGVKRYFKNVEIGKRLLI